MRLVIAAAALALAAPAAAQPTGAPAPLARGEVLLEVNAVGVDQAAATRASFTIYATGRGRTAEEAARTLRIAEERVLAAALAAGARRPDVVALTSDTGRVADEEVVEAVEGVANAGEARAREHIARTTIEVRLRGRSTTETLRRVVLENESLMAGEAVFELDDERAARRRARTDAITKARADAEAYADALGMRIARIMRVTERIGDQTLSSALLEPRLISRLAGRGRVQTDGIVETFAMVGVDYVLAPR